ncbi:HD domain-containing protein [Legionella tunisiensis]|uniref:HD domain-containing protein n=1 Tax=Legionella tunisiensis TaxID=1034944 RepID=UPI0002EF93CF|nr:HD domain-containing protein [Legionella tunisiensis]
MDTVESKIDKALYCLKSAQYSNYIGESVSQLEHALQCAYFAEQAGHCQEVVLASLFHDIGHFASNTEQFCMADLGVVNHEWIGAKLAYDFGFSAKVALLIGYHVDAKRYLAGKKPSYFARLSEASKGTLSFQGGAMSNAEIRFLRNIFILKLSYKCALMMKKPRKLI